MNKKYLVLIIILFIPMISFGTYNIANAHTPDVPHLQGLGLGEITHVLGHILEEEQKQTALLDQIDCYTHHPIGAFGFQYSTQARICGEPLNVTGVWTP